jgi:uncharacterized membrane protein YeaQ/YmgE (transglycosylase-associated protein family)
VIFDIIGWIIIGIIAGVLANLVTHSGHGIFFDMMLGLVGAIVGGVIAGAIFGFHASHWYSHVIIAFVGALIVVGVVRLFTHGRDLNLGAR